MYLDISFGNPWGWFFILIPILMMTYLWLIYSKAIGKVHVSTFFGFRSTSLRALIKKWLPILPIFAAILLVIAIARPQGDGSKEKSFSKGIDIMIAIDISTSMLEPDFSPNRLEAAKSVASEFVSKRPNDRIGIVVFSGESFVLCPPTIDHGIVQKQIKGITSGIMDDGTAIGMGLATSVRSLKNSKAKSKVCILLTDGVNTAGIIDPNTAVDIAKTFQLKVYTIGVGTQKDNLEGSIDEPLMNYISKSTGGIYFRASSLERLKEVYNQINKLETVEFEKNSVIQKKDFFLPILLAAFGIILLYIILKHWFLRGVV